MRIYHPLCDFYYGVKYVTSMAFMAFMARISHYWSYLVKITKNRLSRSLTCFCPTVNVRLTVFKQTLSWPLKFRRFDLLIRLVLTDVCGLKLLETLAPFSMALKDVFTFH